MPLLTCPECDAEFKLKTPPKPGKKVRCPGCEHAFLPDDNVEEEDEAPQKKKRPVDDDDDDDERPKKSKKGSKKKQKSSAMLFILLGGGALLFFGLIACGGIGYFLFGRGGAGGGGGGIVGRDRDKVDDAKGDGVRPDGGGIGIGAKSPTINKATYLKLEAGLIPGEVDAIFGAPGTKIGRKDAIKHVLQYEKFDGPPEDPLFDEPTATYVIYISGPQQVLVGFVTTKKYGEVCAYHGWWDPVNKNSNAHHAAKNKQEDDREYVMRTRADRDAAPKLFADPKWTKGPAIRSSLIGVWSGATDAYEFKKDGKLTYYSKGLKGAKGTYYDGTYKFIDDAQVELSHIYLTWPPGPPTRVYKAYVTASELNLAEKTRFDDFIRGRSYQRQKK